MDRINDKLYSWASILDPNTEQQARQTAQMPFIYPHMALMPDAHLGKGATVGSVIPTMGAIIPAAVGVDIGCGMVAVRTQFHVDDLDRPLADLRTAIEAAVPSSAGRYNLHLTHSAQDYISGLEVMQGVELADRIAGNWRMQLGSLGGGNHFIEISEDEEGRVWAFLHSGSRGVGNRMATHHIKIATEQCAGMKLPNRDLAYLEEGTIEFSDYMHSLTWAQEFAYRNRQEMMDRVLRCLSEFMSEPVVIFDEINCHHNYTSREEHYGEVVWVSRKGAIDAHVDQPGLIPGSMGTRSYVVTGAGDPLSLCSAPHGAGRVYSRSQAKKVFSFEDLEKAMAGIEWNPKDAFIDEIPGAYKDIDQVMEDAGSLVTVQHTLRQLVNVKGM